MQIGGFLVQIGGFLMGPSQTVDLCELGSKVLEYRQRPTKIEFRKFGHRALTSQLFCVILAP